MTTVPTPARSQQRRSDPERAAAAALALAGFMAGVAQVLMARELLDVFYGDEVCIGLVLGSWLFWVAVGSAGAARLGARRDGQDAPSERSPVFAFAILQTAAPLLLLGQIACARSIPAGVVGLREWLMRHALERPVLESIARLLPGAQGEIIGLGPMVACIVAVMAPLCVVQGAQFVLGCRIYSEARRKRQQHGDGGEAIGRAYVWDSVGHLAAGALLSFAIAYRASSTTHAAIAGAAAVSVALWLVVAALRTEPDRRLRGGAFVLGAMLVVLVGLAVTRTTERLDAALLKVRWSGQELVAHLRTPYGSLAVTRRAEVRSFFGSGLLMADSPDPISSEWLAHLPMLQHPRPSRVLLIGGAGGKLAEVLKHNPDRVDYVELDAGVIRLAREYAAPADAAALSHPAVRAYATDGRYFIKAGVRVKGQGEKSDARGYDVVIVALPDPFTTQLSRFYTVEFFREARRAMSEDGVLCCIVTSSPNYLDGPLLAFDACVYQTMRRVFADVKGVPGETMLLLGATRPGLLTCDPLELLQRLESRGIETTALPSLLMDRLQENRVTYADQTLQSAPAVELNRDIEPRAYYYRQALSAAWFGPGTKRLLDLAGRLRLWHIAIAALLLLAALAPLARRGAAERLYVPTLMASAGFAAMVLQIALLLAFQTLCGSVYHKIGLLTGAFMLGLAGGGLWMSRRLAGIQRPLWGLAAVQWCLVGFGAALALCIGWLVSWGGQPGALLATQVLFPLLMAAAGFLVGAIFPLAGRAQLAARALHGADEDEASNVGGAAGTLYAADLVGACLGGLVASTLLIPVLGMPQACLAAAVLNVPAGLLVALRARVEG